MSNITIHTYESYALDYLEGNLSNDDKKAFEQFLADHPAIADEMKDLLDFTLEPSAMSMPNKDALKKPEQSSRLLRYLPLLLLLFAVVGGLYMFWPTQPPVEASTKTEAEVTKEEAPVTIEKTATVISRSDDTVNEAKAAAPAAQVKHVTASTSNKKQKPSRRTSATSESKQVKEPTKTKTPKTINNPNNQTNNTVDKKSQRTTTPSVTETKKSNTSMERTTANVSKEKQELETESTPTPAITPKSEKAEMTKQDTVKTEKNVLKTINEQLELNKKEKPRNKAMAIQEIEAEENEEIAIVANEKSNSKTNKKNKRKKSLFKKLLPEAIAGLSKEELKRSLIPEAIVSAR